LYFSWIVPNPGIYNDINDMEITQPEGLAGTNLGEYLNGVCVSIVSQFGTQSSNQVLLLPWS